MEGAVWPWQGYNTLIPYRWSDQILSGLVPWPLYKAIQVGSRADIAHVVEESAKVNTPQLYRTEGGRVIVPTYDWKTDLSTKFRTVPHIKHYHHFRFSAEQPGSMYVRIHADTAETELSLLWHSSWCPSLEQLLPPHPAHGLPSERQWYLYEHILLQEFSLEHALDMVLPLPCVSKQAPRMTPQLPNEGCQRPNSTHSLYHNILL